ncbi:transposase, MuDR, MULE transposase domain protein [Tanacetum coccineum]
MDMTGYEVPHVLVTCKSRQIDDENDDDENVPLNYSINNELSIQFGREEFCLITGLRFGVENWEEYDTQANLPFRRRNLATVLLGAENKRNVPEWLLRIANDRVAWNEYPWGSYVWPTLYSQLRNATVRRWGPLYVDQPTNEDDWTTYSIFGYTWAFKSFRVNATRYYERLNQYPRVAAWRKRKGRFTVEKVLPLFEAVKTWRKFPSGYLLTFVEQKIELERNKKVVDDIKEEMQKFKEEMNARPVRQENIVPIIVGPHYGLSDFSEFQKHASMDFCNIKYMVRPPNIQTPMWSQPGSYDRQRQMPEQSASHYWQPSSHPGSYASFGQGQVPSHMGRPDMQFTIDTQHDVDGIVDEVFLPIHVAGNHWATGVIDLDHSHFYVLEANAVINLSFKLSSFDFAVDITDDAEQIHKWQKFLSFEPEIPDTPVYKAKPIISKQYSQQSEVEKGKIFDNKESLILAVRLKALSEGFQFLTDRSDPERCYLKCYNFAECDWYLRATLWDNTKKYYITYLNDVHTCSKTQTYPNHRNANKKVIGHLLTPKLQDRSRVLRGKDIQLDILSEYKIHISYQQAMKGKHYGIQQIRTFLNYLRPVLMIDAAHLKGLYKGTNLVAVAMDGNNQIVPIAFGICKGETGPCWSWWMSVLKECIGDHPNLLFISDRHAAITLAIEKEFPLAFHVVCCRHLMMNLGLKNKKRKAGPQRWSRAHCPLVRYNYMTSNSVESVNACSVIYRKEPVLKLAETYRAMVQECKYDVRNNRLGSKQSGKKKMKSATWVVKGVNAYQYEVSDDWFKKPKYQATYSDSIHSLGNMQQWEFLENIQKAIPPRMDNPQPGRPKNTNPVGKLQIFFSHNPIDLSTVLIPDNGSGVISEETKIKLEESLNYLHQMQERKNKKFYYYELLGELVQYKLEIYVDHIGVNFVISKYIFANASLSEMMNHVITDYSSEKEYIIRQVTQNDYTLDQMVEWAEQKHFEDKETKVSCATKDLTSVLITNNASFEESFGDSNPENVRLTVLTKLQEALDEEAILEEQILTLMHRFPDRFTDGRVELTI